MLDASAKTAMSLKCSTVFLPRGFFPVGTSKEIQFGDLPIYSYKPFPPALSLGNAIFLLRNPLEIDADSLACLAIPAVYVIEACFAKRSRSISY